MRDAANKLILPKGFLDVHEARSQLVRNSVVERAAEIRGLPTMPRLQVLCGKNGGLPFNYLMTDVVSGCLPMTRICYGNCSAADHWIQQGHDFGKRVLNSFDRAAFRNSALMLPQNQKWLRQGWASDCSFSEQSWGIVADAADVLAELGISLLIITKAYNLPSDEVLMRLVKAEAEIRVSISSFDFLFQLSKRLAVLTKFQHFGGKAIPYLMTCRFSDANLTSNQDAIINWIVENDFIAAEHPLRFNSDNRVLSLLATDGFWHPKFPDQYWFGRICAGIPNFMLPPPTYLLPEYTLSFRFASEALGQQILGLNGDLPTQDELRAGSVGKSGNLFKHATYETKQI